VLKSFQQRVEAWFAACFPSTAKSDSLERTHRFLEEALELCQASGCSKEDAAALVNYVYGRPVGELNREVGGVLVTLAAYCSSAGVEMTSAGEEELARNWQRIAIIRQKQATKPPGSALPQ
jgi:NTP pyrophosphatase (non-canonical NTP hydrolase)